VERKEKERGREREGGREGGAGCAHSRPAGRCPRKTVNQRGRNCSTEKHSGESNQPLCAQVSQPTPPFPAPPFPQHNPNNPQIMGGPRVLNDEPDFGTFGGEEQRYGDNKGGGWGGGGGVADDGPDPGAA